MIPEIAKALNRMIKRTRKLPSVVVLSTHVAGKGGVAAVVRGYQRAGLQDRWVLRYLATHCDGSRASKILAFIRASGTFLWMLVTAQIGVLHVHSSSRVSFFRKSAFILLALGARVPVILHIHSGRFDQFYNDELGPLGKRFVRILFTRVSRIVALSKNWQELFRSIAPKAKITIVRNAVELSDAHTKRDHSGQRVILFLGRMCEQKGFYDLLHVLARIQSDEQEVVLWAGGDGDAEAALTEARKLGIENRLRLLGWVSGDAKQQAFNEADIFCLPSYAEGLPMALLEAMAVGLPVVTTPVGGIPEIVTDGKEGFVIEPGDLNAMRAALTNLLLNNDLRLRMGAAAYRRIEEEFSLKAVLPQIEVLYADLGAVARSRL